ncbi:MAG: SGNH/GDSL hydrolase family protein [Planctomycetaceae bacterium]|nr:SGNH/GDSL hydrolase family protein [Planctomycetaceae bacterium]
MTQGNSTRCSEAISEMPCGQVDAGTTGRRSSGTRSRVPFVVGILLLCAAQPLLLRADDPPRAWHFSAEQLKPFWQSTTMYGETVLFVKHGSDELPRAPLLFPPTRILSVRSASGEVTYEEGRDYTWEAGSRELVLPAGSRVVCKAPADLRRQPGSQPFALTHRDGQGEILFGGGHEYHDMQTMVTYTYDAIWPVAAPTLAREQLARTLARLQEKKTLKIALLGDSISTGCNASGWARVPPYQPPYQDLLVQNLQAAYGARVTLDNFAVGGTDTTWGLANIGKVIDAAPDLVILAFGMNDSAGRSAEEYQANIRSMMDAVRSARPDTDFILLATMLGNRDWIALQQELFPQYRDKLAALCGPGCALADMTSVWEELLRRKNDWDLTGNGVNHPNDFGHRIYAQVLSALLIAQ